METPFRHAFCYLECQQIVSLTSLSDVKKSTVGMSHDKDEDSDSSPDELVRVAEVPKEKWDCESILSEYHLSRHSNLMFCTNILRSRLGKKIWRC